MASLRNARLALSLTTLCLLAPVATACSSGIDTGEDVGTAQEAALNESKALGMTDVTILYPVPKSFDFFDDMLGPSSEGDQGELLPADLFAQLAPLPAPMMTGRDGKPVDPQKALFADWADSFSLLRVVGIRLDPCFGETQDLGASKCENTIRLTAQFFQPRASTGNNVVPDGRSAIHLFYQVSRQDFTALAKAMLALRKTTGLPLQKSLMTTANGVHPTLAAEGPRGPYATALKDLILKYAGEQTLTQIAFCVQDRGAPVGYYGNNQNADSRWVFGRFDYRGGRLQPLAISTLDYTGLQTVDSVIPNPARDAVIVTPESRTPETFLQSFNRKPEANGTLDPAKLEASRVASLNFQNPTKYTAKTADCASCHMAKQAAPNHAPDPLDFKSYTFRLDHTNDVIGPFRMFGYDSQGNPIVSARVVNESAVVLEYLNKVVMK
jgi:hypothetical protein